ncbi:hypothetical protein Nepgr_033332 [Nepenthes gracilis]|uniref:Putative plant transposon protein domain-containing protein n=1 Tax=Nepenthes gracilis TaxID=150966 RepID=A0AAD3TLV1_NEPGR|nr:hypothetical protein Nepgr_033332 [Nepenthes gracilis]
MSYRHLTLEREVDLASLDPSISSLFTDRHWELVLINLIAPSELLIQEFLANIHDHKVRSFSTFLRGSHIRITPNVISHTLGLPLVVNPVCHYQWNTMPPRDEIASYFHGSPMEWHERSFKTNLLTRPRMVVCWIMLFNLFPVKHFSSLSEDKVLFLYTLLRGLPIDLPSHICSHMLDHFIFRKDDNFPYSCLIQHLIMGLGVQFPDLLQVQLSKLINHTMFKQCQAHFRCCSPSPDDPLMMLL